jgi:hypothetical protein
MAKQRKVRQQKQVNNEQEYIKDTDMKQNLDNTDDFNKEVESKDTHNLKSDKDIDFKIDDPYGSPDEDEQDFDSSDDELGSPDDNEFDEFDDNDYNDSEDDLDELDEMSDDFDDGVSGGGIDEDLGEDLGEEKKEFIGVSKSASQATAKWLIDVITKFILTMLKEWVKINMNTVYQEIIEGEIDEGFLPEIEKSNALIDTELSLSEQDKKMLMDSLVSATEGKPIVLPPALKFLGTALVVFLPIILNLNKIKKRQDMILYNIRKKSEELRENRYGSTNTTSTTKQTPIVESESFESEGDNVEFLTPDDYDEI